MNDQQVCDEFPVSIRKQGPVIHVVKQNQGCFVASVYLNRKCKARAKSKNAGGAVIKAVRRFNNQDPTDLLRYP